MLNRPRLRRTRALAPLLFLLGGIYNIRHFFFQQKFAGTYKNNFDPKNKMVSTGAALSSFEMFIDVNIDQVASFLLDAKSMAAFARVGRRDKNVVYASIPIAIKSSND